MADFQKRHYEAIATILAPLGKRANEATWAGEVFWPREIYDLVSNLADLFERDNPLFDRDRFFKAVYGESR